MLPPQETSGARRCAMKVLKRVERSDTRSWKAALRRLTERVIRYAEKKTRENEEKIRRAQAETEVLRSRVQQITAEIEREGSMSHAKTSGETLASALPPERRGLMASLAGYFPGLRGRCRGNDRGQKQ